MLWALGTIAVYLSTPAVLGLILAHSWYDVASTIASYWSEPAGILLAAAPLAATASVYWVKAGRALTPILAQRIRPRFDHRYS